MSTFDAGQTSDGGQRFSGEPSSPLPSVPQRGWISRNILWVILFVLLCGGSCCGLCCGGFGLFMFGILKESTPYQETLARVQKDPRVVAKLGEPIEASWIVLGNVNITNDRGDAKLSFDVSGPKGTARVTTAATRANSVWTTTELQVEFPDGEKLDLLK
jgi:hypothetical protein